LPLTFVRKGDSEKEETFIDRYQAFGQTVTDAPSQYHVATGVVILSTIMSPFAVLQASHTDIRPNVWAMILAGTTVTRKSTSMDIAVSILEDCHPDFLMATDGSPEGLLNELSFRDGKVSLFHRDEITGFMEAATRKDYNAGIIEALTRLYDGKRTKRILRRETIDITKPRLVFMCGGIKKRMAEVLTTDHIGSGFLPRFLIVSGTTTSSQLREIQFHDESGGNESRENILKELYELVQFWMPTAKAETVTVGGITKKMKSGGPKERKMSITPEAADRIRTLQKDAVLLGEESVDPNVYMPMYTRLGDSILKVAMLLAGARCDTTITFNDVCQAIRFSDLWLNAAEDFARLVEEQPDLDIWEKKIQRMTRYIRSKFPQPTTRSDLMRAFHIKERDMEDIVKTMISRSYIIQDKQPRRNKNGATLSGRPTTVYHIVDPSDDTEFRDNTLSVTYERRNGHSETPPSGMRAVSSV
jgi:hypothetical protein